MAKNTGKGYRNGAVDNRKQYYNGKIKRWVKVNDDTGQIMDVKSDEKPFKGVRKKD